MSLNNRNRIGLVAVLALQIFIFLALGGCSDRDFTDLTEAVAEADPVVFIDAFGASLDYAAFESSFYEALTIDETNGVEGSPALRITVPLGNWAGGSFYTHSPRDLSGYNALTFQAKASQALDLNSAGFGIGIIADPAYQAEIGNVALTQEWTDVIIPVPNSDRLTSERGMFWYSEAEDGAAVDIWFDNVIYKYVDGITDPRPSMSDVSVEALLGESVPVSGTQTIYNVNGEDIEVSHTPTHFTYFSADEEVAVAQDGVVTAVGGGTTTITAKLGETDVDGEIIVTVIAPPSDPAPTPTHDQANVIPIFCDAYTNNITVDTWQTDWSPNTVSVYDQQIQGDNVKAFAGLTNLAYVGIEFVTDQIDAATPEMTHFHMDVYAPVGSMYIFKLVDFGPDRVYGGGDDSEKGMSLHSASTPPFTTGEWVSLEIPLADLTGLNLGNLSQLILQSLDIGNLWVDNIYFYK